MTLLRLPLLAALALAVGAAGALAQPKSATAGSAPGVGKPASPTPAKTAGKPANGTAATAGTAAAPAPAPLVVKPAASVPPKGRPTPRPLTVEEKRDSAMAPGELGPERQVTPQVSIPLGRKPPNTTHAPGTSRGGAIDDSAVRCAAIADPNERALCRERAGVSGSTK